jgi:hypothetical protein
MLTHQAPEGLLKTLRRSSSAISDQSSVKIWGISDYERACTIRCGAPLDSELARKMAGKAAPCFISHCYHGAPSSLSQPGYTPRSSRAGTARRALSSGRREGAGDLLGGRSRLRHRCPSARVLRWPWVHFSSAGCPNRLQSQKCRLFADHNWLSVLSRRSADMDCAPRT